MAYGPQDRKIRVAFVVGNYPPAERKRREDAALAYASTEVEVGIVSVNATPYYLGNAPDLLGIAVPAFLEAFRDAEKQGYDAVVPLGTLDLGVDAGRCVVDIPVIGPSELMLHIAAMLGRRFGILMYDDFVLPLGHRMVERYHMMDKVVGWRTCGFELPDIIANRDLVVGTFVDKARELVKLGADVILPMGITQCPVHIKPDWLMNELGVPVVEGIGAPIRLAAMLVSLKLNYSRVLLAEVRSGQAGRLNQATIVICNGAPEQRRLELPATQRRGPLQMAAHVCIGQVDENASVRVVDGLKASRGC